VTLHDLLSRLHNVQDKGGGKYTARCPGHEDGHNSLSVAQGEKGIVIHCHAGCSIEKILSVMGLSMSDLFTEKQIPQTVAKSKREIEKVYDYVDKDGKLLHQTIRYKGKGFSQRRPDPYRPGQWIYSLKDIEPVIYNLPAVLEAVLGEKPICICEGEKDCDVLIAKNLVATTCPMGAGKWRPHYSEWLIGAYVIIIPDNDIPGKNHAQAVAKSLHGKVKSIKICDLAKELPNLPDKDDLTDFLALISPGEQRSRFEKMLKDAVAYTEGTQPATGDMTTLETISAYELMKSDLPPLREIVKSLLPQGLAMVCAPSKYGKSWLALGMGLSVAAGEKFLSFDTVRTGVLYLALEDGHRRLKKRMGLILQDRPPPLGFDFAIKANTVDTGLKEQISNYLQTNPDTGLIIIDVLQRVRSSGSRGTSAYTLDYQDMTVLKNIADTHQICVLVIHHTRKMQDKDDPFNMISGTTGLMGAADTIFVINKKTRETKEATLHIVARDIEANDLVIEFDGTFLYQWRLVGTAEEQKATNERKAYEADPVVKTIKSLLAESSSGFNMTAGQFTAEMPNHCGEIISAGSAGMAFKRLAQQLYYYDKIIYTPGDTKSRRHSFKRQGATLAKDAIPATNAKGATDDNVITLFDTPKDGDE